MDRMIGFGRVLASLSVGLAIVGAVADEVVVPRPVVSLEADPTYGPLWLARVGSGVAVSNAPDRIYFTRGTPGSTVEIPLPVPPGTMQWLGCARPLGDVTVFRAYGASEYVIRTDGTIAGTYVLRESARNDCCSSEFLVSGPRVFFRVWAGSRSTGWRTDGTREGTVELPAWVERVAPMPGGVLAYRATGLPRHWVLPHAATELQPLAPPMPMTDSLSLGPVVCGDGAAFFERNGLTRQTIWWFDGSSFRQDASIESVSPFVLVTDENSRQIHFVSPSSEAPRGPALWTYTPMTGAVTEHARLPVFSDCGLSRVLVNGRIVLSTQAVYNGAWRYRVVALSTNGGFSGYLLGDPSGTENTGRVVACRGRAYFSAFDGRGRELWSTDGTPEGTGIVADLLPGRGSGITDAWSIVVVGSRVYFSGSNGPGGEGLWMVDAHPADFDNNGVTGVADVLDFVGCYLGGRDRADVNYDGAVTIDDIYAWLATYFAGVG